MITGEFRGVGALIHRFDTFPDDVKRNVDRTVRALGFELEAKVKTSYLRGPRPQRLGVKTGRLLSSITQGGSDSRSRFESTPEKSLYYVGTNVSYGALWEHGFNRKVGAGARGGPRNLPGPLMARYIAKHPPGERQVAARPFLSPALEDMRRHIIERITESANVTAAQVFTLRR
jgi:phage gpG-like protein